MFCPNCGTQNPDTAATCTKCGFNLKGGAAPKFKGTMLMMNAPQPSAGGAPPPAAPPAPAAPVAAKGPIKGTMVGMAPMEGGPPPPAFGGAQPPPAFGGPPAPAFATPPPAFGAPAAPPPAFHPSPSPQPNQFAGTMVAPEGMAPPAFGVAPAPAFGAPPGAPPAFGAPAAPPPAFGGPPAPAFGAPPAGPPAFGGPPGTPPSFGGPPQGGPPGFGGPQGAPPGAMAPMPPGVPMAPTGGFRGETRNPVMVLVLFCLCFIYGIITLMKMMDELKQASQNQEIVSWHILIPYYNLYLLFMKVPAWVKEAKQKAGCANPEPMAPILYVLLGPYALATDLNQVWNPRG